MSVPLRSHTPASTSPHPVASRLTTRILWKLYISHTLSTWNARTFEFGAVIFLSTIFPGTLFFASCYALFRSAAAAVLGPWIGRMVDRGNRLHVVRQSIIWQRVSVACSCLALLTVLSIGEEEVHLRSGMFVASVVLACVEKVGFIANTVAVERDWIVVVSDSLGVERQKLNSVMRRIDLGCKLVAPLCVGLIDGYATNVAIWAVFGMNAASVVIEYFAIAQIYAAVPELGFGKDIQQRREPGTDRHTPSRSVSNSIREAVQPWRDYVQNPAFLASFSLSLLYLTVLSFSSQMTTYLLTLGFTSTHVSLLRLVSVVLELSATCAVPILMKRIGPVRSGLWFINEQLLSIGLAVSLFSVIGPQTQLAGGALVLGFALSRLGLWGFDLCVQYLVQEDAPEATRGSFSAIEISLQNSFELVSFATTMVFYRPEDFQIPIYISVGAITASAACFAYFVRQKRGHLLHMDKCLNRMRYESLPTVENEYDLSHEAS
ncbi:hypothetical protein P153DRAFT_294412 [Dothidotthia symphoricarpi CBS 119687]|uniref:Solute carrier family 40 member n=1 Tax=Dothidotthia symphoricarpi CBS 119687 TaxID=1392245 RepID=A0A6A6A8Q1_9PLEO|nr:uncharacterized protein P153DRAFT_294412 [Dothidotthia symphoricarpi CBS 119687]KAF2127936.1 hypothetical protein P153DRAFT_294412 [Dothidotthia symphoricarpi CBS 119687]